MKVLYINRPKHDYLQDLVYTGLIKILGKENLIEYPWNIRYHLNYRPYPKNIGLNNETFFSSIINQIKPKVFDLVIVASCHPETLKYYEKIIHKIPASTKVIFLDGGDMPEVAGDLDITKGNGRKLYEKLNSIREFDYIFKRDYILDKVYPKNVFSLPFCYNLDLTPKNMPKEFKYDVAFWAVETDPIRTQVLTLLEDKYDCKKNGTVKNQVMKKYKRKGEFYLQELSACKINLNFRGGGWDTLRFWEILGIGGFMISQELQIEIENPFINGKHLVYCQDNLSDLIEKCDYYLEHENKRIKIAQEGKKHIANFHTDIHRAEKILNTVKLR